MKRLIIIAALFLGPAVAQAQQVDGPYSYEDIGKIITALCQKGGYGFRAEIETTCPLILKRLQPQIDAEKKSAEKKDDKQ